MDRYCREIVVRKYERSWPQISFPIKIYNLIYDENTDVKNDNDEELSLNDGDDNDSEQACQ